MRFQVYRRLSLRGWRWYWRLRAENNKIIASGQSSGFLRKIDAVTACRTIGKRSGEAIVEVEL